MHIPRGKAAARKTDRLGRGRPYPGQGGKANSNVGLSRELTASLLQETDKEKLWEGWEALRSQVGVDRIPYKDLVGLVKLLCQDGPPSVAKLEALMDDLQEPRHWRIAVPVISQLLRSSRFEYVFEKIAELFRSNNALEQDFDAWTEMALQACIAASQLPGSPTSRMANMVRPLPTAWIRMHARGKGRGRPQDRRHFNGCPLRALLTDNSERIISRCGPMNEAAIRAYRHATVAWGLGQSFENAQKRYTLLSSRIATAAEAGHLDVLEQLLDTVEEASQEWLTVSHTAKAEVAWNGATWSMLLSVFLAKRFYEAAGKVWALYNRMLPRNEPVDPAVWNGLLSGYGQAGDWVRAKNVWEQMRSAHDALDQHTYTTMISILFRARQSDEAQLLYREMIEWASKRNAALPPAAFNTLILGLSFSDRLDDASKLLNEMVQGSNKVFPKPNIGTVNTMLRAYGRHGRIDGIVQLLRSIGQLGLEPDVITFTTVLDAFSRMGKPEYVGNIYEIMLAEGLRANEVTYSAIIKSALDLKDRSSPARLDMALTLLQRMEAKGPAPTEVTYTNVISGFFDHPEQLKEELHRGTLPQAYGLDAARASTVHAEVPLDLLWHHRPEVVVSLMALRYLRRRGLQPNRKTFHTLMGGILRLFVADAHTDAAREAVRGVNLACLQRGFSLLEEMRTSSIEINERTATLMTDGLFRFTFAADAVVAHAAWSLLRELRNKDIPPVSLERIDALLWTSSSKGSEQPSASALLHDRDRVKANVQ